MFMLTSTHKAKLEACHTHTEKWMELAKNRKQQIYLLEKKVKNLEEQASLVKQITKPSIPEVGAQTTKKGNIHYNTDNALYYNRVVIEDTSEPASTMFHNSSEYSSPSSSYDSYNSSHSSSYDSNSSSSDCSSD